MAKAELTSPRAAAARALVQVIEQKRSLTAVLPTALKAVPARDRGLAQELCYGVLRWFPRLDALLGELLEKPIKPKEAEVKAVLLCGLYQLLYLNIPPHAAVAESVGAVQQLGRNWAKGLTNGVLRNFQRDRERLLERADRSESARYAHPNWLLALLQAEWPDHWQTIATANNQHPPLTLRNNRLCQNRDAYRGELEAIGLHGEPVAATHDGLIIEPAVAVERLPGFTEGRVSVQDGAAQLAAQLLALAPGQRVLDACAAPGGKTGHILEQAEPLDVVAIDKDASRLALVQDNLSRLGLAATLVEGDAANTDQWWDGVPFDRILLDAPCSASGVIRRHPDIKLLRQPADLPALVAQQSRLLEALWPLLRPGGLLVYATCSVLPDENSRQVTRFLRKEGSAREMALDVAWGHPMEAGRQILPGEGNMDGFYYACLRKE